MITGDASTDDDEIPDGVFVGSLFRQAYDPSRDFLVLTARIPESLALVVTDEIRANAELQIDLRALILSYGNECDDWLRAGNYPRQILVESHTSAAVRGVEFVQASQLGQPLSKADDSNHKEIRELDNLDVRARANSDESVTVALKNLTKCVRGILIVLLALLLANLSLPFL